MVNNEIIGLYKLKEVTKAFLDNNGDGSCLYCNGKSMSLFSDHPQDVVVSLSTSENSNYVTFIAVHDELSKAYYELREVYGYAVFGKSPDQLNGIEIKEIEETYSFILSEVNKK